MNDFIPISSLNDFIFCPYSIYLHGVYSESDEEIYHAPPQTAGRLVHAGVDGKSGSTRKDDILGLPVYSETLGVMGKIDLYRSDVHLLIERKNHLKNIYRGQLYQLWAQYFCMIEMGYLVEGIAFYEIAANRMIPQALPTGDDRAELETFIRRFRHYNPSEDVTIPNKSKCLHCIYCNLCDRTDTENVYT